MTFNLVELIGAILEIAARHQQQTGEVITKEVAAAQLSAEIEDGRRASLAWFMEHGQEPPQ